MGRGPTGALIATTLAALVAVRGRGNCQQVQNSGQEVFRLPDKAACESRKVHLDQGGKAYHFSWLEHPDRFYDWEQARNYCREFCMDSVTIDSKEEYNLIQDIVGKNKLEYVWTGGHKCNFEGCDRPDLQPAIVNGWYWAPTLVRIPAKDQCTVCDWSQSGGLNTPQPDNREFIQLNGGEDEACISIMNNFYQDGIRWHDVACRHLKPVICQESQTLIDFISSQI